MKRKAEPSRRAGRVTCERSGIITLLTDFGGEGAFVGVMKGVIARINPQARVVDLGHSLTPFDPVEASLLLRGSYAFFPRGTVHVVVVDPGVGSERRILAAQAHGHIFLAPDNGILAPVLAEGRARIVRVSNRSYFLPDVSSTFHGRDIFAPVAAHLAGGVPLQRLGPRAQGIAPLAGPAPRLTAAGLIGRIVLCDRFGNLISDIPRRMLAQLGPLPRLRLRLGRRTIRGVSRCYADAPPGEAVALIGSLGTLEIACNRANARKRLAAGKGDAVRVFAPVAVPACACLRATSRQVGATGRRRTGTPAGRSPRPIKEQR